MSIRSSSTSCSRPSEAGSEAATYAYKFLARGTLGRFSRFAWPVDEWVEATGPLAPCQNGVHACRVEQLPTWIDEELWTIELGGDHLESPELVLARRGRLVERVPGWNGECWAEFADACSQRAQKAGGPYADEAATFAEQAGTAQLVAVTAYVSARAAEHRGADGFRAERRWQASWLRNRLALAER
ncbi:MAG: hypothetical protein M3292_07895 [Actinomycetota bacterium]|nr:hypothetical protein [Actinomycetota bacterium]